MKGWCYIPDHHVPDKTGEYKYGYLIEATVHAGMANYNTRGFKRFLRSLSEIETP